MIYDFGFTAFFLLSNVCVFQNFFASNTNLSKNIIFLFIHWEIFY